MSDSTWSGRPFVDSLYRLDARVLERRGGLTDGARYAFTEPAIDAIVTIQITDGAMRLTHRINGPSEKSSTTQVVPIERTDCRYGGNRPWFRCPGLLYGEGCGRRCALLFFHDGHFACRTCHRLLYRSQFEHPDFGSIRRAEAAHLRLGGTGVLMDPIPPRPRYMHRSTYYAMYQKASLLTVLLKARGP